ncbi:MAG: TlpA family protein disulfide reductase [Myxococcaceae bacterium]|nr:TlpA family protein disulfide reductase [Myxococcaceae bacterium]
MSDDVPVPPPGRGVQLSNTVIIGGLLAIAGVLAVSEFFTGDGLSKETPAPDAVLVRPDGTRLKLSELKGQVVLLNFWATWCPPCNEEMPELVAVAKSYGPRGVVFVAANPEEGVSSVEAWLASHADVRPYVALTPPETAEAFHVQALPTTYVIGRDGTVRQMARGRVQGWRVTKWLDDAL